MEPDAAQFLSMNATQWLYTCILLATIAAIIYGPIKAVKITRKLDKENEDRSRKLAVFRSLMKTRQARLSAEHVGAINLIEIEFYGTNPIVDSYSAYIRHLNAPLPAKDEQDHFFEERNDLFVDLLQTIGNELNYDFDKRDLGRLAYAPVAWELDERRLRYNQGLLTDLLEGKRSLPISTAQGGRAGPFPPPPEIEG